MEHDNKTYVSSTNKLQKSENNNANDRVHNAQLYIVYKAAEISKQNNSVAHAMQSVAEMAAINLEGRTISNQVAIGLFYAINILSKQITSKCLEFNNLLDQCEYSDE